MNNNSLQISIKKNLLFSILAVSFRLVANVFVFWLLARIYDPSIFGQFTFAHSLATTLIVIADFGFDVFLTTEISANRPRASKIFSNLLSYKLVFTATTMVVMFLFSAFVYSSVNIKTLVFLFSFFLAATTLTNFLFAFFRGIENLIYEMKVSLMMNALLLIVLPILLIIKVNIILVGVIFISTRILGLLIAVKYSKAVLGGLSITDMFQSFGLIRTKMFIFGFHFVFSYIFFQLDTILLLLLKGEYDTGIYQAVFKFIMLPLAIPEIIMNVLLPVLTRVFSESRSEWIRIGGILSKTLTIIVLPIFLFLFTYSEVVVRLVYGAKYIDAAPILKIFSLIILVRFLLEPFALMLTTANRQQIRLVTVISATIINIILNIFFIPQIGAKGAAMVSLITNLFVGLVFILYNWDVLKDWFFNKRTLVLLSMIIVEIPVVFYSINIHAFAGIILIVFFFVASLYIYFTEYEKKYFMNEIKINIHRIWKK